MALARALCEFLVVRPSMDASVTGFATRLLLLATGRLLRLVSLFVNAGVVVDAGGVFCLLLLVRLVDLFRLLRLVWLVVDGILACHQSTTVRMNCCLFSSLLSLE